MFSKKFKKFSPSIKVSKNIECTEKEEKEEKIDLNYEKKLKLAIGTYQEAPEYIQDNEYIKTGYILNCNTYKKAFLSLFICHNETVNIWSHLLGAIFFIFLIWYTSNYITNFKSQLLNVKKDISLIEKKANYLIDYEQSKNSISQKVVNDINNEIKEMKINLENFNYKYIYENSLNKLSLINNDIPNISNITIGMNEENKTISNNSIYINSSFINNFITFKKDLTCLKEDVIDLIKLDKTQNKVLVKDLKLEERPIKNLGKWPLFIIIISAILCLSFSSCFHLIKAMSSIHNDILNRFDYGGISLLISGSCFPPYYYFFYHSNKIKIIYLTIISILGIGTFFYSLTDDFNKPKRRTLRGILFLIFGLFTGIPILHIAFFGHKIRGYGTGLKLINWYLGGISYVIGALLYILRLPEKKFPGKFDYIGASHQLFHIFVFFGALFHFLGSIDAYNYRFGKLFI